MAYAQGEGGQWPGRHQARQHQRPLRELPYTREAIERPSRWSADLAYARTYEEKKREEEEEEKEKKDEEWLPAKKTKNAACDNVAIERPRPLQEG